jgi:SHS2 domain-containing protein
MPFAFFDHTGDIGVRLTGRTLDDLFESASAAFTETITDPARIEPRQQVPVALESSAVDLLLVEWLSEMLYRFDAGQFLVGAVQVHVGSSVGGNRSTAVPTLQATLLGEPFDGGRHGIKVLVKAITYHALEVHQDADGWHATVVFDI